MNNDKLKKKIVEVLFPVIKSGNISCNEENACKKCWFPCEIERTAGRLADALIAAGIGDVKSLEISDASKEQSSINYYCEMREWKDKCRAAEHRAAVARAALKNCIVESFPPDICSVENCSWVKCGSVECKNIRFNHYIKQAEKELAEERKDENN